jgi:hypothetical protein
MMKIPKKYETDRKKQCGHIYKTSAFYSKTSYSVESIEGMNFLTLTTSKICLSTAFLPTNNLK